MDIEKHIEIFARGSVDLISVDDLRRKLIRAKECAQPLVIKYGADPSSADIHLGHTVPLRKLRELQELGHQVIFLIGDFTAMIGDPTGRSETRPRLTREQVNDHARTYQNQVFRILDRKRTTVVYNSSWLDKLSPHDFLTLTAKYTVARILERDDFKKRFTSDQPITILEFLYPLLQGYDSVALKADMEIGGTDQKFNLLVGRELQRDYGQEPQVVMTLPLIEGTDGVQKMSKSYGNSINLNDSSRDMLGKLMSIPDRLILKYFLYLTARPEAELKRIEQALSDGSDNPRHHKMALAKDIISFYFNAEEAERAEEEFNRMFRDKGMPDEIPAYDVAYQTMDIVSLIAAYDLVKSKGEARRLIAQGGVKLNGEKVVDANYIVDLTGDVLIQCGKRVFAKFTYKQS